MIAVLNYKPFDRGSIKGFFDLRYHGLTIKSCRLLNGNHGLWFSFPQIKAEEDGETKYFDQMFLTTLEREHICKLVLMDLQQQGLIEGDKPYPQSNSGQHSTGQHLTPEGENLDDYYRQGADDIPF
jgi:hypothetical protein